MVLLTVHKITRMEVNKMYKRRNQIRGDKPQRWTNGIEIKDAKKPEPKSSANVLLSTKAMRNLPKSGSSITPKLDPYTSTLPGSDPYALLNALNKPVGGKYGGLDNLDGGNTQQFVTSERSKFLKCFDTLLLETKINYRYLPIAATDTARGKAFTDEMIKAISEIVSLTQATTFTSLAYSNYKVDCDIPVGTQTKTDADKADIPYQTYQWLIYYQLILQSISGALTNFNKFRANIGNMMRMSWNRETPRLNSYFGLMQKKSFLAQFESLCLTLRGEYFDLDWMQQYNMLNAVVSRRSNAFTEPVLEMGTVHTLPSKFKLTVGTEVLYDHAQLDKWAADWGKTISNGGLMPSGYEFDTFAGACHSLTTLLSINDTLGWVRGDTTITEQNRFNAISNIIGYFTVVMNYFKPRMGDLRAMLNVLQRSGVNQWQNQVVLNITQDTDLPFVRNLTVENIYQMAAGGADEIAWNATTYRWASHSMWNMYTGVPEYDSKAGGAFISFSSKTLKNGTESAVAYLPIAFNAITKIRATNRLGEAAVISYKPVLVKDSNELTRLIPLEDGTEQNFKMRVPYSDATGLDAVAKCMLSYAGEKVFGSFSLGDPTTATADIHVDTDNLCFVVYEIEDFTNDMITYARCKGPFRVNSDKVVDLGFAGFSRESNG